MKFVRFEEKNDHEGETWNWWLQLDDNEDELMTLQDSLEAAEKDAGFPLEYTLSMDEEVDEDTVDTLVQYSDEGYYPDHNKVVGEFICPLYLGFEAEKLYKGGINAYFYSR